MKIQASQFLFVSADCLNHEYGVNCNLNCSVNCFREWKCNSTSGACAFGCKSGYRGAKCNTSEGKIDVDNVIQPARVVMSHFHIRCFSEDHHSARVRQDSWLGVRLLFFFSVLHSSTFCAYSRSIPLFLILPLFLVLFLLLILSLAQLCLFFLRAYFLNKTLLSMKSKWKVPQFNIQLDLELILSYCLPQV